MNLIENTPIIDLHCHTNASDGDLSPVELIELAVQNEVRTLAITDHDTVAGYESVRELAEINDVRLISGVEVSTIWEGIGIHIVGLNFDSSHPDIVDLLAKQTEARQVRAKTILDKLQKAGMKIAWEELQNKAGQGQIGRPHIARIMVEKGYVKTIDKAFKKYLGSGKMGDVKSGWVSISEAVLAIQSSGGVAVIAHPNHYKMTRSKLLRMIDEFVASGGKGIEVISGKQHRDITEKFAIIANERKLYASIGSDFHRHLPYAASLGKLSNLPDSVTPVWPCFS